MKLYWEAAFYFCFSFFLFELMAAHSLVTAQAQTAPLMLSVLVGRFLQLHLPVVFQDDFAPGKSDLDFTHILKR